MDEQLIRAAQRGDEDAFFRLIQRYDREVMSVIYRFSGDRFDREDLYQEIFLQVFRSIRSFRFRSDFRTWLYRLALNRCISWVRKRIPVREVTEVPVEPDDWERRARVRAVVEALDRLPARQQMCFHLYYVEGWKLEEIASAIGARPGTVKSHLYRAREKLKSSKEVLKWQPIPT